MFSEEKALSAIIQEAFSHREDWLKAAREYLREAGGGEEGRRMEWVLQKYESGETGRKNFRLQVLRLEKEVRAEMLVERQKMRLVSRKRSLSREVAVLESQLS